MNLVAIVFDYDGTLVHLNIDFKAMRQGVEALVSDYGFLPNAFKELYILEMIDEATRCISERNPSLGQSFHHKALDLVTDHEVRAAKKGEIIHGVIDMLHTLRSREIKVGIITRNCEQAVKLIFPDIEHWCDAFVPRDYVDRVKPHPDHLTMTLQKMGVDDPSCCFMVGDHVLDIEGGKRKGMKTAGVLTGNTTRQHFMEAGVDLILDDATGIIDHIFEE